MRDSQRAKVYAAENVLYKVMDNSRDNPTFSMEGITVTLPPEAKFGSLESIQAYVDRVLSHPAVLEQFPWAKGSGVSVRRRRGTTCAHYERTTQTIAIPDQVDWFMRELLVLHELAHHLSWDRHGPQFVAALIALQEAVMGPEVALIMRMMFSHNGVREGKIKGSLCV